MRLFYWTVLPLLWLIVSGLNHRELLPYEALECPLSVQFEIEPGANLLVGESAVFINTSTRANAWEWYINEKLVGNSSGLKYVFEQEGVYVVKLRGYQEQYQCWQEFQQVVSVLKEPCGFTASFKAQGPSPYLAGTPVDFVNTSTAGGQWEWYVDGTLVGSALDLTYTFPSPGSYLVTLRVFAKKRDCWQTHGQIIEVQNPEGELFCGEYKKTENEPSNGEIIYDRFGNIYTWEELMPKGDFGIQGKNGGSKTLAAPCDCGADFGISTGRFDLYFEDCSLSTQSGFADATPSVFQGLASTLGADRRRTLCQVFADLDALLATPTASCSPATSQPVRVQVMPSTAPNYYSNGSALAALPASVGGSGSGYTVPNPTTGVADVMPWLLLNNPTQPSTFSPNPYHGFVRFNFDSFAFPWHLDYSSPTVPAGQIDFYSAALHESIHMLGMGSFIDDFGGTFGANTTGTSQGGYSRWDGLLHRQSGNVPVVTPASGYGQVLNTALSLPNDFQQSCAGNDVVAGSSSVAVFTGSTFQRGSSLSHVSENCNGNLNSYVMHPYLATGLAKRTLHTDELGLLEDLGYSLAAGGSCIVSGGDDPGMGCTGTYTMQFCPSNTLTLTYAQLTANDVGATGISHMELIGNSGTLTALAPGNPQTDYVFTPLGVGGFTFRYIPTGCNGQSGNVTYVGVTVEPCGGVAACAWNDPANNLNPGVIPHSPCGGVGQPPCIDCGLNNNPDNLICNPEMCANDFALNEGTYANHFDCFSSPLFEMPGWTAATGTPHYWPAYTNHANTFQMPDIRNPHFMPGPGSGYLNLMSLPNHTESMYTPVAVDPGKRYLFSLYKNTGSQGYPWMGPSVNQLNASLVTSNVKSAYFIPCSMPNWYFPSVPATDRLDFFAHQQTAYNIRNQNNQLTPNTDVWGRVGAWTDIPGGFAATDLWIYPQRISGPLPVSWGVDQVELIEDTFAAGLDMTSPCPGTPLTLGGTDFGMLSDVRVQYTWTDPAGTTLADYWVERELSGNYMIFDLLAGTTVAQIPAATVAPGVTTTYTLTRTFLLDTDGTFGGLPSTYFDQIPLTDDLVITTGSPGLVGNFTTTVTTTCPTLTLQTTADPAETGSNFLHSWDFNGDGIIDVTGNVASYTFPFGGTYPITHYVTTSCGQVTQTQSITMAPSSGASPSFPMEFQDINTTVNDYGMAMDMSSQGLVVAGLNLNNTQLPLGGSATGCLYVARYGACGLDWLTNLNVCPSLAFNNLLSLTTKTNAAGDVYVLVNFTGSVTVGSNTLTSQGGVDFLVIKLASATGQVVWAAQDGGSGDDYGHDMEVLGSQVYVTGRMHGTGTANIGGNTLSYSYVPGPYGPDFTYGSGFTARYTDTGTGLTDDWGQALAGHVVPTRMAVDATGNAFVVGAAFTPLIFNGTTYPAIGDDDVFVVSYSATGNPRWAQVLGSSFPDISRTNNQSGEDIGVNSSGTVYVTFQQGNPADLGSRITGLNANSGATLWSHRIVNSGSWQTNDPFTTLQTSYTGSWSVARGLVVDASGNVLVSGLFQAGFQTGGVGGYVNAPLASVGGQGAYGSFDNYWNSYTVRFSPTGTTLGVAVNQNLTGDLTDMDGAHDVFLMDMVMGPQGELYQSLLLDGQATFGTTTVTGDEYDAFITRQSTPGIGAYFRDQDNPTVSLRESMLELYPNPAGQQVTLHLAEGFHQATATLLDLRGRVVMETTLSGNAPTLQLTNQAAGTYVLVVKQQNRVHQATLVIASPR